MTLRFQLLGLGRRGKDRVDLPDGDFYELPYIEHTFPCVGRKISLKAILAHYVQLTNDLVSRP